MKNTDQEFLCCPACHGILNFTEKVNTREPEAICHCVQCQSDYKEKNGYIDFLNDNFKIFNNRREKILRTWYARFYTPSTDFMFIFCGGARNARKEVLNELRIKDGDTILETGVGPGDNFPGLNAMASDITLYGIDIQDQMLSQCIRNSGKWNFNTRLFRANAEDLPFRDQKFDVVFHLGAFNLFNNKSKAVREMIRVAKPGSKIVIADESEKGSRIFNRITGNFVKFEPPLNFIPDNMSDIQEKIIWKGFGYVITFIKP